MATKKKILKLSAVFEEAKRRDYSGLIVASDPIGGVAGWIVSPEPAERLALELVREGVPVHGFVAVRNDRGRPADIRDGTYFEFTVTQQDLAAFSGGAAIVGGQLSIRVAGSDFLLPCAEDLARINTSAIDAADAKRVHEGDFLDYLNHLKTASEGLLSIPLRSTEKHPGGFIEAICFDDQAAGLYWFVGWKYASNGANASAVIVDEQKYPAAFSIASYPREDLPQGAHAIIGVIRSEWNPSDHARPILQYGRNAEHSLHSLSELRALSKTDFLAQLQWVRQRAPRNNWADLFALFNEQGSWIVNFGSHPDVHLAIDRLIVLEGCGCFVSGWALSFLHPVASFALKFGSEVLTIDPGSLRFLDRNDLDHVFPGAEHISPRAGFVGFFQGSADMQLHEAPQIKIILEGGQSVVFPIDVKQVRRLAYSEPIETLEHFYPSIEHEGFFGKVARSLRENHRRQVSKVTVHRLAPCQSCLIVACPDNENDTHFILDDILRNAPSHLPPDWGIVLAVGAKVARSRLLGMMISASHDLKERLTVVSSPKPAAIALCMSEIVRLTGMARFALIGADSVLTAAGWTAMEKLGRSALNDIVFLETVDPHGDQRLTENAASFAWNTGSFHAWVANMPVLLNEPLLRTDFPDTSSDHIPGATHLLRRPMPSRVASLINMDARKRDATEA